MATRKEVWAWLESATKKRRNEALYIVSRTWGGWLFCQTHTYHAIIRRCEMMGYRWNFEAEIWERKH